jgi:hypothetical protein
VTRFAPYPGPSRGLQSAAHFPPCSPRFCVAVAPGLAVVSGSTPIGMSVMSRSDELSGLTVLPPEQALEHARPVPKDAHLVNEDLTDAEWKAFITALADR